MRKKSDSRREAIVQAAAEVFQERGFDATSMSEVAVRVGGSKATLYNYFDSKEALFGDVMLAKVREHAVPVIQAFCEAQDIKAAVRRFTLEHLRLLLRPEILCMNRMTVAEGGRRGLGPIIFEQAIKPAWSSLGARLQSAMDEGQLRPADPWRATMHLKALSEGGLVDQQLRGCADAPTEAEIVETAAQGAEAFLRAYAPDKQD